MRQCIDCGERFEPARHYHRQCWRCWKAENPMTRTQGTVVRVVPLVDSGTLKAALALAHPDLHPVERQQRALRVTQELSAALAETRALERAA